METIENTMMTFELDVELIVGSPSPDNAEYLKMLIQPTCVRWIDSNGNGGVSTNTA